MKCNKCGKPFTPKRRTARFCSDKCRVYSNRAYSLNEVLENSPKPIKRELVSVNDDSVETVEVIYKKYDFCKHDSVKGLCKKGCK